jgi:signal transduction histidine kinase
MKRRRSSTEDERLSDFILDPSNIRLTLSATALLLTSALNAFQSLPHSWVIITGVAVGIETLLTGARIHRKQRATRSGVQALEMMVSFLESLNRLAPALPSEILHQQLAVILNQTLKPLAIHARLWLMNPSWKALKGLGDHPALRPGSPSYLPMSACPAYALHQPFNFHHGTSSPCPSEQFNYAKHRCLPVVYENECYGVLFLGSYAGSDWTSEENHLFRILTQAMALALQRKTTFERLQEKIAELNVTFEVGATALATFAGSTQSLDETTIHLLDGVLSILKVERASLMLWDSRDAKLRTQWVRGGNYTIQSPMALSMGEGMAGWALQTGQPYWAEYATGDPHYRPSAQPIQSLLCVPVFTFDQQPLGVINAVTTHTARTFSEREVHFLMAFARQAAMAIENAQLHHRNRANIDQLSELNKIKSQFLSLVSHDLRGPLTGIRGFCEVLKEQHVGALNDVQMDMLDQLEKQVQLQERMVDDLLDFARMEKGQLSIQPAVTSLETLLKEEVDKSQREARDRGHTLTLTLAEPSIPDLTFDEGRIRQVVWNLIHNAMKFTPEGGQIRVRSVQDGSFVRVEVEDTGVGLSPDTQDKIFEKFFQVTPGGSRGAQGLGLGLAICKEIILAHHGKIRAQSPGLGLGTTISFTLPMPSSTADEGSSLAA